MDGVTAKFRINEVKKFPEDRVEVELNAVYGDGEENKTWAKYTPSGSLRMTVDNPSAARWFDENLGREVLITLTLAGK